MLEMFQSDCFWIGVKLGVAIVIVWAILVKATDMWRHKKLLKNYDD